MEKLKKRKYLYGIKFKSDGAVIIRNKIYDSLGSAMKENHEKVIHWDIEKATGKMIMPTEVKYVYYEIKKIKEEKGKGGK